MEANLEIYLLLGGLLVALFGHLWLVWRGFHEGLNYGILALVPVVNLLLLLVMYRKAVRPLLVVLVGVLLAAGPIIVNRLMPIDLGPREKEVDGELHITLTGWDRSDESTLGFGRRLARWINNRVSGWDHRDYSALQQKREVVVLQMANPDVTDETLIELQGLDKLKELDLSDTSITDDGLKWLARLPALETLRLSRTSVTDGGIREHLMAKQTLKRLELLETSVTAPTRRDWRQAQPGRATMPR